MTTSLKCSSKSRPWGLEANVRYDLVWFPNPLAAACSLIFKVGWGPCLVMTILHQLDGEVEKLIADDDDEYNEDDKDKL